MEFAVPKVVNDYSHCFLALHVTGPYSPLSRRSSFWLSVGSKILLRHVVLLSEASHHDGAQSTRLPRFPLAAP